MNSLRVGLDFRPTMVLYPPATTFGPRTLSDFELVWILAGGAQWFGNDTQFTLRPDDVLLAGPGTRDEFRWDARRTSRHGFVHFRILDGADRRIKAQLPLLRRARPPDPFAGMLGYLLWLSEESAPGWQQRTEDILAALVRVLLSGPLPQSLTAEPPALAEALDHVCTVWSEVMRPISLTELATAASVTPSYLTRIFRAAFGRGPVSALEGVRLDHARTLLERTNLTVTEVARASGFDDPLHFSRRFRASTGMSPRGYRATPATAEPVAEPVRRLKRRVAG